MTPAQRHDGSNLSTPSTPIRRRSLLAAAAFGAGGLGACASSPKGAPRSPMLQGSQTVLFQGDSITDAGRSRKTAATPSDKSALGSGYAWLASASLLANESSKDLRIFNRGISGHKVFQLAKRWDKDCLDLQPDLLSILIGVNDIWHSRGDKYDGTVEVYERDYMALVQRTRESLPNTRIVLCEPFVLRCGAVDDSWFPEFDDYRAAAKRVSDQHQTDWVPFQSMFDRAAAMTSPEHWAADGVHPSKEGASLMAAEWLRVVGA